jgi:phosphate starvation-inducible PhoH-like protein
MGAGAFDTALKLGNIEIVPFEVMRGRSWDNALIILDEAQNTSPEEIKMFLTRIGKDSQVIINGDVKQTDLKVTSGLRKIIHMIKSHGLPIPIIEFTVDDIVRSDICAMWVRAFDKEGI